MFHGSKYVFLFITALGLAACSGSKTRKADCYDCELEAQSWKDFSWGALSGQWKGTVESTVNEINAKVKVRSEQAVAISFTKGKDFLAAQNVSCHGLPEESLIMQGHTFQKSDGAKSTFEVFGQASEDRVTYGRVTLTRINGSTICEYHGLGGYLGKNRLSYPSLRFTERLTPNGRFLASGGTPEYELNFDFLNFDVAEFKPQVFEKANRRPASVVEQDRPPLFFRVFQINRKANGPYANGEWTSTTESLYRLWRVN